MIEVDGCFCLILLFRRKMNKIQLIISILVVAVVTTDDPELVTYSVTEIQRIVKTSHVLVALNPKVYDLLLNVKELFRNELLQVGIMSDGQNTDILWETLPPSNDVRFAFYRHEYKSRNCLITPSFFSAVKPYFIPGDQMSLSNVVDFLNSQLFTFIALDGSMVKAGMIRQRILNNFFNVSKKGQKCERIRLPGTKDFIQNYLFRSKPVIIENAINDWPAMSKWTAEYLRTKYGYKKIHVKLTPTGEFEGCDQANKFKNYASFKIPENVRKQLPFPDLVVVRPAVANVAFSTFLDMVENNEGLYNLSAYLEYSSIPGHFPELSDDLSELGFIYDLLELSNLNIWLSNGNTLGKLHFDPYDNILCQLRGRKKLTLFSPHSNHNLYEAHIQEAMLGVDMKTMKFQYEKLLDSTSMVMSPIDITQPNYDRFPDFSKAISMECILNEGDILYMPSFWWHEVQSYPNTVERRNLAVNFWYDPFLKKDFPCAECKMDVNAKYRKLLDIF